MTRSTWIAVLVTAGLLALAGALPRALTTDRGSARAAASATAGAAWRRADGWPRTREWLEASWTLTTLSASVRADQAWRAVRASAPAAAPAVGAALAGAFALSAVVLAVRSRRGRRAPVRRVLVLARAGRSHADIARECGLPQDAVRALLRPRPVSPRPLGR